MMDVLQIFLCILLFIGLSCAQQIACPADRGWNKFGDKCYLFKSFPKLTMSQAETTCEYDGATLLSVNTAKEHDYIDQWLRTKDQSRTKWWTSGRAAANGDGVIWDGDGTTVKDLKEFVVGDKFVTAGKLIVYSQDSLGTEYGWNVADSDEKLSFICEISVQETYRIVQQKRGFDYGLNIINPSLAPRGPKFLQQPTDTSILGPARSVHLECLASGIPEPTYEWRVEDKLGNMVELKSGSNSRLTFTSGKLVIQNPNKKEDTGKYQCVAKNEHGIILSSTATLSFGELGEFSNVAPAPMNGKEYKGAQLECPNINGKPAILYSWYKNTYMSFIRPENQKASFVSSNGKLFFSELSPSDEATYFCVATLSSLGASGNYIGQYQSPTRQSLGVKLNIASGTASNYEPDIQNDFIHIFPSTPMRGDNVRLECFAYGTLPLIYRWEREGKPLPPGHSYINDNHRILVLPDVGPDDNGLYTCHVQSTKTAITKSKSLNLIVQSKPFFTYPLTDQHVDVGDLLIWYCEASGTPPPKYVWYKNSEIFTGSSIDGVTVQGNTLTINSLNVERDNGMYQCAATNDYGTTFSSAQLRVLKIAPSFAKNPMLKSKLSATGGDVTLFCDPTAAPLPTYTWFKDDADLNLQAGIFNSEDHLKLLRNGNLLISDIRDSDQGRYTCKVENNLGTAEDFTNLVTMEGTQLSTRPSTDEVEVNMTATLLCKASHAKDIDMVYEWKFNDHKIDYVYDTHYRQGTGSTEGALYITAAQFKHEGWYTCTAITSMGSVSAQAYLTVLGPPAEPAGVHVSNQLLLNKNVANQDTTRTLIWTNGENHGGIITHYFVEYLSEFDDTWKTHPDGYNIPVAQTTDDNYLDKHIVQLTNLKAGAGIRFRVKARNVFGLGPASIPTDWVQIVGAKPSEVVKNVNGGEGKIGDLTITWDPLPKEDHNGEGLKYKVFWREHDPMDSNKKFSEKTITANEACNNVRDFETGLINRCRYVHLVGAENYYKEYDAKVQTINDKGDGPITEPVVIWSAEALPLEAPTKVYADQFNATALRIRWEPIPNTRKSAHGKLKGYKVNYWSRDNGSETQSLQNIFEIPKNQDNLNQGIIIGLEPRQWYLFNVQAYNSAGNGPKSSDYEQQCFNKAPSNYPTEVHVSSTQGFGVRVTFRGISTEALEEPLIGYKVQYWKSNENILSAAEADFGKMSTGVLRNLTDNKLYQLRVYGYSRAGQGRRSSPSVYFTVGEGELVVDAETMEIMNSSPGVTSSVFVVVACLIAKMMDLLHKL